ncbi:exported hypothetical protein [Gammaproteobacteria bacterium]
MNNTILMNVTAAGLLSLAVQGVAIAEESALTPNTAPKTPAAATPAVSGDPALVMGGGQLMTPEEWQEQNRRIMSARTPEERWAYMAEQQRQMQERAAKQAAQIQTQMQAQIQKQAPTTSYNYWGGQNPQSWSWQSGYNYGPGYSYDYGYSYAPGYGPPQSYWHGYCPTCQQNIPSPNQIGPGMGNQLPKSTCVPTP